MKPQTFEAIFTQGVCSKGHVRNFLEIASCQKEAGSSSNHQFSGARVCGPTPFSTSKRYSNFEIMATIDTKSLALYTLTIKKSSLPQGIQGNVPSHLHFMGFISAANPNKSRLSPPRMRKLNLKNVPLQEEIFYIYKASICGNFHVTFGGPCKKSTHLEVMEVILEPGFD